MKDFTAKHAPGLFQMLLSAISRHDSRISPDHQKLSPPAERKGTVMWSKLKTGDGWNPAEEELSSSMSCSLSIGHPHQKTKALQNQFGHHCCLSRMDKKLCHKVLKKFQLCKDIEYSCLLFLLDEVIPLSFFHYPVTFRSGNLDDYMAAMLKLSILFITWSRFSLRLCWMLRKFDHRCCQV